MLSIVSLLFLKDFSYLFLERQEGGWRKRERETSVCGYLSCTPLLGTWAATQPACALTGNRTCDSLVHKALTQSTELHQPGFLLFLMGIWPKELPGMLWRGLWVELLLFWRKSDLSMEFQQILSQKKKTVSPTAHSNGFKKNWLSGFPGIPVTVYLEVY